MVNRKNKMNEIKASFGSMVNFKNYSDVLILESIYTNSEGMVIIKKLPETNGFKLETHTFRDNGKPTMASVDGFRFDEISYESVEKAVCEIDEIIDWFELLQKGDIFYNEHEELTEKVIVLNSDIFNENNILQSIKTSKLFNCTVLFNICTSNDKRFYLPIVKEDSVWDVKIRFSVYLRGLSILKR